MGIHSQPPYIPPRISQQPITARGQLKRTKVENDLKSVIEKAFNDMFQIQQAPNKRGPHPDVLLRRKAAEIRREPRLDDVGDYIDSVLKDPNSISSSVQAASTNAEDLEHLYGDNPDLERSSADDRIWAEVAPIAETVRQAEVVNQLSQSIFQLKAPTEQKSPFRLVKRTPQTPSPQTPPPQTQRKPPNQYDSVHDRLT